MPDSIWGFDGSLYSCFVSASTGDGQSVYKDADTLVVREGARRDGPPIW